MDLANVAKIIIGSEDNTGPGFASAARSLNTLGGGVMSLKDKIAGLAGLIGVGYFIHMINGSIEAMDHLENLRKSNQPDHRRAVRTEAVGTPERHRLGRPGQGYRQDVRCDG